MRADSKHRSVGDCVEPYDTQQSKDVKYRWKLLKKKTSSLEDLLICMTFAWCSHREEVTESLNLAIL